MILGDTVNKLKFMKAKLSKEKDWYELYRIDEDGKKVTFASTQDYKQKLSLKNCQAIECGYYLDDLVEECCIHEPRNSQEIREVKLIKIAFKDGFQKALELMGDKKFTEKNVLQAFIKGVFLEEHENPDLVIEKYLKSLQQNEWEVEILDERDSEGCLILKRVV